MWKTITMSFISAILGGLLVFFAMTAVLPAGNRTTPDSDTTVATSSDGGISSEGLHATEVYRRFAPGVAHIRSVFTTERTDFFGFRLPPQEQEADGSGFIIDKSGLIVTNAHVVQDSNSVASKITVTLGDDEEVEARLLGTDPSTDIALLKINPGNRTLRVLKLGDSSKLKVGNKVYAIGSPFELEGTMTEGIISALNRTIDSPNRQFKIRGAIQTDAAVNPGNSGGPLINASGEVIGINSQIASSSGSFAGIAFAVPSNTVKEVTKQIKKGGRAQHPWLGISGLEVTSDLAQALKLPVTSGVMLVQVVPGSPAEKAGLKGASEAVIDEQTGQQIPAGGDILTRIDDKKITTMEDLLTFVEGRKVGETVKLELYRGNQKQTISLKLGERPQSFSE